MCLGKGGGFHSILCDSMLQLRLGTHLYKLTFFASSFLAFRQLCVLYVFNSFVKTLKQNSPRRAWALRSWLRIHQAGFHGHLCMLHVYGLYLQNGTFETYIWRLFWGAPLSCTTDCLLGLFCNASISVSVGVIFNQRQYSNQTGYILGCFMLQSLLVLESSTLVIQSLGL